MEGVQDFDAPIHASDGVLGILSNRVGNSRRNRLRIITLFQIKP